MVLVLKRRVLPILDGLQVLVPLHLGVEQAVFVDVFLVLDLLRVRKLGQGGLMLFFQLLHSGLVFLQGSRLFFLAAGRHVLVILGVVVGFQVTFRVGDQLGDLVLVLGLDGLGLLQLLFQLRLAGGLFLGSVNAVALEVVQAVLEADDLVGAVDPQLIDLGLDLAHVFLDRFAELHLALRSKNRTICHLCIPHSQVFRTQP